MLDAVGDILGFGTGRARDLEGSLGDIYKESDIPKLDPLQLEELVLQGQITPEEASIYLQDASAMGGITLDPRYKMAQEEALKSLQDLSEGGLTDMDRANLANIALEENTAARGRNEALLQDYAQRGLSGSGMEMLARMQNDQDAATRRSTRDTQVAGLAQQRALEALQQAGQLGGQMSQTEFGQKAQIAQAQDAINQFNTQNRNQMGLANVQARNAAQEANLAARQGVADKNVDLRNTAQQYNKATIPQQNFENKMAINQGKSGAVQTQAQGARDDAAGNRALFGSILGAGATIAASDKSKKKVVDEDFDASEFLDSITPAKYRYKDPEKFGKGVHASPMAQDLEKSEIGKSMVMDTPEGKMVDYGKGFGAMLASLADIHERLKQVEGR